ncbi:hypothetical protein C943_01665 [Mariniradius saccharolyticus AK6]|uniref:Uncharacterized protein n=1 Tax=Mariniradius saccharolyticus AK6 TaxID=1239962 RepID=M7X384_9BACT|nr:hypothetical protein C943_01665 [Mariniradius saccharolyticus AK6]
MAGRAVLVPISATVAKSTFCYRCQMRLKHGFKVFCLFIIVTAEAIDFEIFI